MKNILWWKKKRPSDYVWSKKLSVGNAILDSEHRNLIAKVNSIMRLIEDGDGAALSEACDLLEAWLVTHFGNEQKFAQTIGLDFEEHEISHQRLLGELRNLKSEMAAKNWTNLHDSAVPCYQFLHDLLIEHIVKEDMQMKPALMTLQYDYAPSDKDTTSFTTNPA